MEKLKSALLGESKARGMGGDQTKVSKVTVKKVAKEIGVSMWHLNRLFKKIVGCPPQAWAQEQKRQKRGRGR